MKWFRQKIVNIDWLYVIKNEKKLYDIYFTSFTLPSGVFYSSISLLRNGEQIKHQDIEEDDSSNIETKIEEYKNYAKMFEREIKINKLI